jgi:hypothetical protein
MKLQKKSRSINKPQLQSKYDMNQVKKNFLVNIKKSNNVFNLYEFFEENKQYYPQPFNQFRIILFRGLATSYNIFLYTTITNSKTRNKSNLPYFIDDDSAKLLNVNIKPTNTQIIGSKYRATERDPTPEKKNIRIQNLLAHSTIIQPSSTIIQQPITAPSTNLVTIESLDQLTLDDNMFLIPFDETPFNFDEMIMENYNSPSMDSNSSLPSIDSNSSSPTNFFDSIEGFLNVCDTIVF